MRNWLLKALARACVAVGFFYLACELAAVFWGWVPGGTRPPSGAGLLFATIGLIALRDVKPDD